MAQLPPRDLEHELHKHFWGTPEERIRAALRLGEEMLALFLSTLPPGTTREEARRIAQRNRNRGRHPSAVMDTL